MFAHELHRIETQARTARGSYVSKLFRDLASGLGRRLAAIVDPTPRDELMSLSDRELHDIGIGRGEIDYALAHGHELRQPRPRLAAAIRGSRMTVPAAATRHAA